MFPGCVRAELWVWSHTILSWFCSDTATQLHRKILPFSGFPFIQPKTPSFLGRLLKCNIATGKNKIDPRGIRGFSAKIPFHSQDILLPGNFSELASASPLEQSWRWNWIPQQPVNLWIYGYLGFENKQQIHTNTLWAFCGIGFIRFNGQLWKTPSWKPKGRVRNVKNHIRVVVAPGSPFSV